MSCLASHYKLTLTRLHLIGVEGELMGECSPRSLEGRMNHGRMKTLINNIKHVVIKNLKLTPTLGLETPN